MFRRWVCGLKLASVDMLPRTGPLSAAGSGEPVLSLHARRPSEAPKGSSGGARGVVRCGDAASRKRMPRA